MRAWRGTVASVAVVVIAAACSNNSNGPRDFPPIGGNYQATFQLDLSNSVDHQTLDITGTISLSNPNVNGDFDGTYAYDPPYSGGGRVAGNIAQDGSIVISEWGDPGAPPMMEMSFLSNQWPHCDFTSVTTSGMGGSLSGSGLSLQGSLDFGCDYTNGPQVGTFPTTLTETVTGS